MYFPPTETLKITYFLQMLAAYRPRVNLAYHRADFARASFVNVARICGTNFWRDLTRARHIHFFKFCPIFKMLPHFQNFARFSKFCSVTGSKPGAVSTCCSIPCWGCCSTSCCGSCCAIEEEAGQNEVQQVHVLAAQAPVVTHPGCPLQTFAALMMLTLEYRMEQRL